MIKLVQTQFSIQKVLAWICQNMNLLNIVIIWFIFHNAQHIVVAHLHPSGRAGVRACGQAVLYISSTNLDNLKAYCLVSYVKLGTPFWV